MTTKQSVNQLLADLLQVKREKVAWMDAALDLDARLAEAQSNVRALLEANHELQATVKLLSRAPRLVPTSQGVH